MGKVVCPKCEKDDQIQKVVSIVTNGVATTDYYAMGNQTAVSQTQLSKRLSPPKAPPVLTNGTFSFILNVVLISGIGSACITIASNQLFSDNFLFTFLAVFILIAIISSIWLSQASNKAADKHTEREHQLSNWREFYYCHRDDCVFDPRTNKYTSPEGMDSLL